MTVKLALLRSFLSVAEQRTNNWSGLATVLAAAREDGEVIACRVITALSQAVATTGPTAEREDEAYSILIRFIGERADALRAAGTADNEALAYALGATIAAVEAIERAKVQMRRKAFH